MLLCPEHTHTSPNKTLDNVIVLPPDVAVMAYAEVRDAGGEGKVASHVLSFNHVDTTACTGGNSPTLTVTVCPSGTKPQTVALAGADCSTCEDVWV
jgi:hypothetical protein